MIRLVAGLAIGYVLGARAGRDRYEQIVRLSSKAADSPAVQGAAGFLRAKVTSLLTLAKRKRKEPAGPDIAYLFDEVEPPPPGPAPIVTQVGPPKI